MTIDITLPLMGEGVVEAQIGTWLKAEGEPVAADESLVEIETDKVTTEIVAEQAGTLLKIVAAEGEMVQVGQILAVMSGDEQKPVIGDQLAEESEPLALDRIQPEGQIGSVIGTKQPEAKTNGYRGRVSPVVARMVERHALNLDLIGGTGKNGRITKHDIQSYLKQQAAVPSTPSPQLSPTHQTQPIPSQHPPSTNSQLQPHTAMRRRIAEHMVLSKRESPHATTVFEVDFHAVAQHRQAHKELFAQRGAKLTYMAYIASGVIQGLQTVPQANSRWQDDGILLHHNINLGVAAAIDNGLVVPIVQQADQLNLFGLAQQITQLAQKARAGQLQPIDMQGGTFTITNHGVFGSLFATPIINQPQAGILGVGAIEKRVCVIDDMIAVRPKAYLSFSFDHRILDGADADRFMQAVKQVIEGWKD